MPSRWMVGDVTEHIGDHRGCRVQLGQQRTFNNWDE